MAGNEEHDGAVENIPLVFAVCSEVCGSLPWGFNISGQALFPEVECLAQMDEQLARHQVLVTPAPTQAPGDNGNPPCFGQVVTFTCCCTSFPAPCGSCSFLPVICKRVGFCFPLCLASPRVLWRAGFSGLSLKHPVFKRHCRRCCISCHSNNSVLCTCSESSGERGQLMCQGCHQGEQVPFPPGSLLLDPCMPRQERGERALLQSLFPVYWTCLTAGLGFALPGFLLSV